MHSKVDRDLLSQLNRLMLVNVMRASPVCVCVCVCVCGVWCVICE